MIYIDMKWKIYYIHNQLHSLRPCSKGCQKNMDFLCYSQWQSSPHSQHIYDSEWEQEAREDCYLREHFLILRHLNWPNNWMAIKQYLLQAKNMSKEPPVGKFPTSRQESCSDKTIMIILSKKRNWLQRIHKQKSISSHCTSCRTNSL